MSVGWRSAKLGCRHARLVALFALACLVGLSRPVNASCGDHLSQASRTLTGSAISTEFAFANQRAIAPPAFFKPQSEGSCRGPQCHRRPAAPVQEKVPILTMAPRVVFVAAVTATLSGVVTPRAYEAALNLVPLMGIPARLERPPE